MFKRGTIVLIPFPFTDLSGAKVRPAVIVSREISGDDVVVVFISSVDKKLSKYDVKIKGSINNGLKVNSFIKCSKIATLEKKIVLGELGVVDKKVQKEIDQKIKIALGL